MRNELREVVITGVGLSSVLGEDFEEFGDRLFQGELGISSFKFDFEEEKDVRQVAFLPKFPDVSFLEDWGKVTKLSELALFCAKEAMDMAGLQNEKRHERWGVSLGSGFINLYDLEESFFVLKDKGRRGLSPRIIPMNMGNASGSLISMYYKAGGYSTMHTVACASGTVAMKDAFDRIRYGDQDVMISGAMDLTSKRSILYGWENLRAVTSEKVNSREACIPFGRKRSGFVLGEGGCIFVLESREHAERRGAKILARITGVFQNNSASSLVQPDILSEKLCIEGALRMADVLPENVGMIHAHATGTKINEEIEYRAIKEVLKSHIGKVPICAIKSQIGHTMGASGCFSIAAALRSFQKGYVYPIYNLSDDSIQEDFKDLCYYNAEKIKKDIEHIVVNTIAFGGVNSTVVLSRYS